MRGTKTLDVQVQGGDLGTGMALEEHTGCWQYVDYLTSSDAAVLGFTPRVLCPLAEASYTLRHGTDHLICVATTEEWTRYHHDRDRNSCG